MLAVDLGLFRGQRMRPFRTREAAWWSLAWVSLALGFGALLWWYTNRTMGPDAAAAKTTEFITGYVIELSLSVDNIFVFLMLFKAFNVTPEYQRRVLLYGVMGAIGLRAGMILAGGWLLREFHWVMYAFGAFLAFAGVRMLAARRAPDLTNGVVLRFARRHLRVADGDHGEAFTVVQRGVRHVTRLFLVLILVEAFDVVFAMDSIPAIFAITRDPFIVFSSNVFAIMGLRALFFLLQDFVNRFHLLTYGLAAVLILIGAKMLVAPWFEVPTVASLLVVLGTLGAAVLASLLSTGRDRRLA